MHFKSCAHIHLRETVTLTNVYIVSCLQQLICIGTFELDFV